MSKTTEDMAARWETENRFLDRVNEAKDFDTIVALCIAKSASPPLPPAPRKKSKKQKREDVAHPLDDPRTELVLVCTIFGMMVFGLVACAVIFL